jgi:hypothetical protein
VQFLNVDLDLHTRTNPVLLVTAMAPRAHALHVLKRRRGWFTTLELARAPSTPEATIRSFIRLIDKLPARARREWKQATRRSFNIGIEAASAAYVSGLSARTMKALARLGAGVEITVYPPERGEYGTSFKRALASAMPPSIADLIPRYKDTPFVIMPIANSSEYAVFRTSTHWELADAAVSPISRAILRSRS